MNPAFNDRDNHPCPAFERPVAFGPLHRARTTPSAPHRKGDWLLCPKPHGIPESGNNGTAPWTERPVPARPSHAAALAPAPNR